MKMEAAGPLAFNYLKVILGTGEMCLSEAGAMVRMTSNIDCDVTTRSKGKGGILAGLKRLVGGDSFFLSKYTSKSEAGEVVIAPMMMGQVKVLELDGSQSYMCSGGSYLANSEGLELEPQWQGMKGFFSGESLFYLKATGKGQLAVSAFGQISSIPVEGEYIVDTGHVVAYSTNLQYEITKAGGSWMQSFFAGEGLVMRFKGHGELLVQSHNPNEFGSSVGPDLPPRD
jgi:uncharacterized protein (TIGR00266 family)